MAHKIYQHPTILLHNLQGLNNMYAWYSWRQIVLYGVESLDATRICVVCIEKYEDIMEIKMMLVYSVHV